MKYKISMIEKVYRWFHVAILTLLIVFAVLAPIILGYSIMLIGLSVIIIGIAQIMAGIVAKSTPSLFRLKSTRYLNLWLILSVLDLLILTVSIFSDWPTVVFGTMVFGILLSFLQYAALTSKRFKLKIQ